MKKVRVFHYMDADQKKRLEELSRSSGVALSEYMQEAIEEILLRHEGAESEDSARSARRLYVVKGLKQADA